MRTGEVANSLENQKSYYLLNEKKRQAKKRILRLRREGTNLSLSLLVNFYAMAEVSAQLDPVLDA